MARPEMAGLIARLRTMTDGAQGLSEDQVQARLDPFGIRLDGIVLLGDSLGLRFQSPFPNLDTSAELRVNNAPVTTGFTVSHDSGLFVFITPPAGYVRLYATAYDLHRAAAGIWLELAGRGSLMRGQYPQTAMQQVKHHLGLSWTLSVDTERV